MDEKQKQLYTIIGSLIMVGSMFWGIQFLQNQPGDTATAGTASGTTEFNGTIRTYEPFLVVLSMPDSLATSLRNDARVKAVTGGSSGYIINASSREDVYSLAQDLRAQNVSSSAIANIILPAKLDIRYVNGSEESVDGTGSIGIWTEPFVDIDGEVTVRMTAVTSAGSLVSYSSPVIVSKDVSFAANATVASLTGKEYSFMVPWENRTSVDEAALSALYGNGSAAYSRNDFISFQPALTVSEITARRALPYITFISDTGASVSGNFTDMALVMSDFNGTNVTFPQSELKITTNESVNLSYPGSVAYGYVVSLPSEAGGYSLGAAAPVQLSLPDQYEVNGTISVIVSGTAMGGRIVSITGIGPG
jgi:hypothetical protein